jgi:regulator of nucleoside diphosphate kinase
MVSIDHHDHHDHHDIIITDVDMQRLQPVLEQNDSAASDTLDTELRRAHVVDQRAVPADVVTMNSELVYEDCDTGVRRTVKIVYPSKADASKGHISVLAPIGSALLGLRVGQRIEWEVPTGRKRVRVVELRYQPEASGDFEL